MNELEIVGPICVGEGEDYDFFRTVAEAERYIEPWFPDSVPEYEAFDSTGALLRLVVEPPVRYRRLLGVRLDDAHRSTLRVERWQLPPATRSTAEEVLRVYLRAVDPNRASAQLDLDELFAAAIDHAGYTQ